jgi:hypothetical protein
LKNGPVRLLAVLMATVSSVSVRSDTAEEETTVWLRSIEQRGGPRIQVSLPGETEPLWDAAMLDDMIAARIVSDLRGATVDFPLSVSGGVVSVPPSLFSPQIQARLGRVPGVREVRSLSY